MRPVPFLLCLLLLLAAPARSETRLRAPAAPAISFDEAGRYAELRTLALELLRRYPPSEYFYLGLGRSPAPLMAFLEAAGLDYRTLPLSKLKGALQEFPERHVQQQLRPHLAAYLPEAGAVAGRRLLLVDFVFNGPTLLRARQLLRVYFAELGRYDVFVKALGIFAEGALDQHSSTTSRQPLEALLAREGAEALKLAPNSILAEAFAESRFDELAEYDEFNVVHLARGTMKKAARSPTRRQAYDELVAAVKARLAADEGAESALAELDREPRPLSCEERLIAIARRRLD